MPPLFFNVDHFDSSFTAASRNKIRRKLSHDRPRLFQEFCRTAE